MVCIVKIAAVFKVAADDFIDFEKFRPQDHFLLSVYFLSVLISVRFTYFIIILYFL